MRRPAALVALILAAAACAPTAPTSQPTSTVTAAPVQAAATPTGTDGVLAEARQFVYRVRNPQCLSTGTAFDYDGAIITNRHVAAGADTLQLSTWSGTDFTASTAGHSGTVDLARLSAGPPGPVVAPPAGPTTLTAGTPVYVTGYPQGDQLTVTAGTVVALISATELDVAGPVMEISATVQPGNSGSPVLDAAGRLVGVVFALDARNGHGLAMPLSTLSSFLTGRPSTARMACVA